MLEDLSRAPRRPAITREVLVGVVASLLVACGTPPAKGIPKQVNGQEVGPLELSSPRLVYDTFHSTVVSADPSFGVLVGIAAVGRHLVVTDNGGQPFIHVLDRETGVRLFSFGRSGEGPGEFPMPPWLMRTVYRDGYLWLSNDFTSRLTGVKIDFAAITPSVTDTVRVYTIARGISNAMWLPNGKLLRTRFDGRKGYLIEEMDSLGHQEREVRTLGVTDARFPQSEIIGAYMHTLCPAPSGRRFAIAFSYAGRVDFYSDSGELLGRGEVPFDFKPILDRNPVTGQPGFKNGERHVRRAYQMCHATERHVFALFSGRLNGEDRGLADPGHAFVHVFDWRGRLVRQLLLDHGTYGIAVDSTETTLYSVGMGDSTTGPVVRKSTIPATLDLQ